MARGRLGVVKAKLRSGWLRRWRRWLLVLSIGFVGLNALAFRHAWAMSHFAPAGNRTESPEELSRWAKLKVLFTGVSLPRPVNRRTPAELGLEFATVRVAVEPAVDLEAWRIPSTTNGPVVVAFGGYGGSKDGLLPVAREFHRMGAEVWLVDFRGCGGSSGDVTSIGFHEADDVAAAVRQATTGSPRPVLLFGTSMGAAAALHAVHRGLVSPAGMILECPFDRLLSTAGNRFRLMHLPEFPLAHLLVFWGGAQLGFNGLAHNPVDYAVSVRCPTLLFQGDRDRRVTVAQAGQIAEKLGTNGRFVIFSGLGHESYLAGQPERWREEVSALWFRVMSPVPPSPSAR
jgi:hypothetical protein